MASDDGGLPEPAAVFPVDMALHKRNRLRLLERLRASPPAGGHVVRGGVVLLQGTPKHFRDETDDELLTRQESNFHYLFGVREPDFYGAINVDAGTATLYMPRLPAAYAIWQGAIKTPEDFLACYGVDRVLYVDEMPDDLKAQNPSRLFLNKGFNTDGDQWSSPATFEGIADFQVDDSPLLYDALVECRVTKSEEEIALMQYVNDITSDAHLYVMRRAKAGLFEYQLESLFLHSVYFRGKCRHSAYTSICGCGPNAAVLHYGHAGAPNDRLVEDGDMLLLDMGAEYHRYASDVTCSFPASGVFTSDQKAIFEAVASAQAAVMAAMKPGVLWPDMQALAYVVICEQLTELGLLAGASDPQELVDAGLGAVFMPHGLGHLMGIDTHDPGGYPMGAQRDVRPGFSSLRCVRALLAGMVITVEPGIYFIDVLLDKALADPAQSKFIVPDVLARFRGFGGVRLEDDVLVTSTGVRNLTNCPRTVADVEGVMAGRITHRSQLTPLHYTSGTEPQPR